MLSPATTAFIEPYTDITDAADRYLMIFRGRNDAYALQSRDGSYHVVREPVTRQVMERHLMGNITVGLYLITPVTNTCSMAVIDVDHRSREMAVRLIEACNLIGCDSSEFLLETSGNKGFHAWFMFKTPRPAWTAIMFAETVCRAAGMLGEVEIFPKQKRVPEGGYGNLIKLPGLHRKSGRFSKFFTAQIEPISFSVLDRLRPVPDSVFTAAVGEARKHPKRSRATGLGLRHDRGGPGSALPCIARIFSGVDQGRRNTSGFILALHLKHCGLPPQLIHNSLAQWNRHNRPPLVDSEIRTIVNQAMRPLYHGFSCASPDIQPFCDAAACPRGWKRH